MRFCEGVGLIMVQGRTDKMLVAVQSF